MKAHFLTGTGWLYPAARSCFLRHQFNYISLRVKNAAAVMLHPIKPRLTDNIITFHYQLAGEFVDTFPAANREGQTYRIGGAGLHGRGYGGWSGGYDC